MADKKKLTEEEERALLGGSAYDQQFFTTEELRQSDNIRKAAEAGTTDWQSAHDFVENIRNKYGYSGGLDGSSYTAKPVVQQTPKQSEMPSYISRYQGTIDTLRDKILNRDPFSYDYRTDPAYQSYAKQYTREGQRATQDTLGQLAAMTGGMPSTAASVAASQAGDYYASKLADQIPALRNIAYQQYADEGNRLNADLSMLMQMENNDYSRFLDQMDQYNADRAFDYQQAQDALAQQNWQTEFDYQKILDDRNQANIDRDYQLSLAKIYNAGKGNETPATVNEYDLYEQVKTATGQTNIFTPEQFNRQKFMQERYGTYENYCKSVLSNYGISYNQLGNKLASIQTTAPETPKFNNDILNQAMKVYNNGNGDEAKNLTGAMNYLWSVAETEELFIDYCRALGISDEDIKKF